jgi:hypothetical protein
VTSTHAGRPGHLPARGGGFAPRSTTKPPATELVAGDFGINPLLDRRTVCGCSLDLLAFCLGGPIAHLVDVAAGAVRLRQVGAGLLEIAFRSLKRFDKARRDNSDRWGLSPPDRLLASVAPG